jgi:tetratricopeptide (TPR) repeat protein
VARILLMLNKRDDARSEIEQSISDCRRALELNPENGDYRSNLHELIADSAIILLELGHTAMAAKAAEELPRLRPQDLNSYYRAAILLTDCLTASKDESEDYGGRAVGVLQQAVNRGLIKEKKQLNHTEFRPLKLRDDFDKLYKSIQPPRAA